MENKKKTTKKKTTNRKRDHQKQEKTKGKPTENPAKLLENQEIFPLIHGSMYPVTKIVNNRLEFIQSNAKKLLQSTTKNFLVVGIIGKQGVGKTTLISELCGKWIPENQLESKESINDLFNPKSTGFGPLLFTQSEEVRRLNENQTSGVDLCIDRHDKILFLDLEPVFSASILANFLENPKQENITIDDLIQKRSFIFVVWLFSVCHLLLVVQDSQIDLNLWNFLKTAQNFLPKLKMKNLFSQQLQNQEFQSFSNIYSNLNENQNQIQNQNQKQNQNQNQNQNKIQLNSQRIIFIINKCTEQMMKPSKKEQLNKILLQNFGENNAYIDHNIDQKSLFFIPKNPDLFIKTKDFTNPQSITTNLSRGYSRMLNEFTESILSINRLGVSTELSEKDWISSAALIWHSINESRQIYDLSKNVTSFESDFIINKDSVF
ncbi:hypothetical protein M0811_09328 [Anaeramoeba ignava]|uniref:Protein SMG9 n=1 Tax=Anaeramoeba ignava TaxID=1746090 RepID=A0A9Q0RA92_ANAIG|nr:hypothetical protein M0811_09328 [Anaeramoeba ignava]